MNHLAFGDVLDGRFKQEHPVGGKRLEQRRAELEVEYPARTPLPSHPDARGAVRRESQDGHDLGGRDFLQGERQDGAQAFLAVLDAVELREELGEVPEALAGPGVRLRHGHRRLLADVLEYVVDVHGFPAGILDPELPGTDFKDVSGLERLGLPEPPAVEESAGDAGLGLAGIGHGGEASVRQDAKAVLLSHMGMPTAGRAAQSVGVGQDEAAVLGAADLQGQIGQGQRLDPHAAILQLPAAAFGLPDENERAAGDQSQHMQSIAACLRSVKIRGISWNLVCLGRTGGGIYQKNI